MIPLQNVTIYEFPDITVPVGVVSDVLQHRHSFQGDFKLRHCILHLQILQQAKQKVPLITHHALSIINKTHTALTLLPQ